ncbi:MAG: ice-binding family protein [Chloroflexota bacterium]
MKTKTIFLIISILLVSFSAAFAKKPEPKPPKPPKPGTQATLPVDLGTAGTYAILTKSGISSVPKSAITGNIGVSPIDSTAITGFSLKMDASGEYSSSTQVRGKVFAANYGYPTPIILTTAIRDMETAYTDAAGRSPGTTELGDGDISGLTLAPGVYKWGTGVSINDDVTLDGNTDAVFIFQIAGTFTQAANTSIILTGGAQAKNIFWQVAETVAIRAGAHFEGIVLAKTNVAMVTGASVNGRLLAQTAVTLIKNTIVAP